MRNRHRTLVMVALLLGAACGQSGSGVQGQTLPSSHVLTVAAPFVEGNTDPHNYDIDAHGMYTPLFVATLFRYKSPAAGSSVVANPADIEGELVQNYTLDASGLHVALRKGVKSAAGHELTASDVQWSLQRALALPDRIGKLLLSLAGASTTDPNLVTVTDAANLTIKLNATPLTLVMFEDFPLGVIDSTEAKAHATASDPWAKEWMSGHSTSFAAYDVESFTAGSELRLVSNPNYFRGAAAIKHVTIKAVPDSGTRLQLIKAGQVDIARQLAQPDLEALKTDSNVRTVTLPSAIEDLMYVDMHSKPFSDARVRRAVSLLINRDALIKGPYHGLGGRAPGSMITSAIPQQKTNPPIAQDVAKAKQLLTEAGYPSGFSFTLTIAGTALYTADAQSVAVLLSSQLQAGGLTAKIQTVASQAEYTASSSAHPTKFQAWLGSARPLVPDSAYFLNLAYVTNATSNSFGFSDPAVDSLVATALKTPFGAQRLATEQQLIDLTQTDVPSIPLADVGQSEAVRNDIKGQLSPNVHYTIFPQSLHY